MAKTGRTLQELAAELERQRESRKDYSAPVERIQATVAVPVDDTAPDVALSGLNGGALALNDLAHGQLAEYAGIPKAYYDRTRAAHPDVLARDLNAWIGDKRGDKRLVRTLDGRVRAWLSNRYRPLDNYDLAQTVLPTLIERRVRIVSADLTESRIYIKGLLSELTQQFTAQVAGGGTRVTKVAAAVTISNSEVGAGALRVEPSVFTYWCENLAVVSEAAMRKYHVGRAFDAQDDFDVFTDATRKQDDVAFWMKVRDVTHAAFNEDAFQAAVDRLRGAAETPIASDDIAQVVEVTTRTLGLPDGLRTGILTALAREGDMSKWGLAQAITATANTVPDYELATQMEHAGGRLIDLTGRPWDAIANAG